MLSRVTPHCANLLEVGDILVQNRPNHTRQIDLSYGTDQSDEEDAHTVTTLRSEILEIFGSVTDSVEELFKLSMLIRNATPRDRYSKATVDPKNPFDDNYDIAHVGEKHPKLEQERNIWLKRVLGKAITQRREFLRYARNHRHKLAADELPGIQSAAQTNMEMRPKPAITESRAPTRQVSTPLTNSLGPTKASTLLPHNLENPEIFDDDAISTTSLVTSTVHDGENTRMSPLSSVSNGRPSFECPYCWHIIRCKHQRSWRYVA